MTRDDIRNTASTLAHYWHASASEKDRAGIVRLILTHAAELRPALCVAIARCLEKRKAYTASVLFEVWLLELAGLDDDEDERAALKSLAELEQARDAG